MISIDVNSLNDREQIADAIAKLTFVLNALKKDDGVRFRCLDRIVAATFGPADGGPLLQTASDFGKTFEPMKMTTSIPFMDPQEAVQDDGIVCLIDGKKRRFLSRYVQQVHGMEWQDYLDRYDLPADYPQTCKDLIEQRRKAAIDRGFGKHDRDQEAEQQQVQVTVPIRKTFGRRGTSQQVSVQVDIGRSVNTTADRRKERKLEGLL